MYLKYILVVHNGFQIFHWRPGGGGRRILQPATPKSGADPGGAPGALPPKIGKDVIFLRKMVIFHTKYPKNFRGSLRSAQFF